ncbi:uncharacterized protein GGS22DRAFT_188285 [Annulohypoxylon maeteangense]|uniref:uncharacterized protein n=1 Tax=Annulohypoxylon maeteangense TaxID=1927788 RepID=UPI002007E805|nr:uncharacterized protein GGS22DRAFT_188285 [Annulohypoxylon maeteangense]KAI0885006.1 hypothetical protein GGS22DRAFT_188285 [Annulohypoxylon maeteangense]
MDSQPIEHLQHTILSQTEDGQITQAMPTSNEGLIRVPHSPNPNDSDSISISINVNNDEDMDSEDQNKTQCACCETTRLITRSSSVPNHVRSGAVDIGCYNVHIRDVTNCGGLVVASVQVNSGMSTIETVTFFGIVTIYAVALCWLKK